MQSSAEVLDTWHWRSPLPQGNALEEVVFANGGYVAVGQLGTILTSSDGTNWQRRASGVMDTLRDCAYGGGQYVAVGDYGTVMTSPDLVTWTPQYAGTFFTLNGVTYGNGQFVAVGDGTMILTSPDGVVWTQRGSGEWDLFDVAYGGGAYVAVGGIPTTPGTGTATGTGVILTSPDGRFWTHRVLLVPEPPFVSVAYGAGTFAAVEPNRYYQSVWSSTNLADWQSTSSEVFYGPTAIAYGAGKWVVASGYWGDFYYGPGLMQASDDLVSWSSVLTNFASVSGIAFGNGRFLAGTRAGTFLNSSDGMSWQNSAPEPVPFSFAEVKYLDGQFVGVRGNQLSFSVDGTTWTNTAAVTNTEAQLDLGSITFGNGRYVAGGQYRTVWTSLDGLHWTNPAPELASSACSSLAVAFGNGVFVGVCGYLADILTSPDGLNWTAQQLITNNSSSASFSDVTFGNGRFVAVSGVLLATSVDGTNWASVPAQSWIRAVVAGNGKFVAVGDSTIALSTNGLDWTYQEPNPVEGLLDVAVGAGFFVAVGTGGYSGLRHESPIWVSADGSHWSRRASWTPQELSTVAFGDGTFVIGGYNTILQSDPLVNLELAVQSAPHLLLWGPANRSYSVEFLETLTPLSRWSTLTNVFASQCPVSINDTNGWGRFYRAALLPR